MDGIKEELDEGDMKESPSPTDEPHSATSTSSIGRDEQGDRPKKARRTFLTQNACNRCKSKALCISAIDQICNLCTHLGRWTPLNVSYVGCGRRVILRCRFQEKRSQAFDQYGLSSCRTSVEVRLTA